MRIRILCVVLVLLIVTPLSTMLTGCSAKYPYEKGSKVKQIISTEKEYTVGDLSKTGWRLEIPKNTFDDKVELTMDVLSSENSKSYEKGEFKFIGTPVVLKIAGKENIRLGEPIKVTFQLPRERLKELAAEKLFYGYYYNDSWEYYTPDSIDFEKGTATFSTYHFSILSLGEPSEEDQIETFAKNMAVKQWETSERKKEITDATSKQFDNLFSSMGVTSKTARNQLAADVISYLEDKYIDSNGVAPIDALAQMANSASQGEEGMQAYKNKLLEYTGKALVGFIEGAPEKFAKSANLIGSLSRAAGYLDGGDNKAALAEVAEVLKGLNPIGALADSTLKYVKAKADDVVDCWTKGEIEKAYQVYIGNGAGKYGYESGFEGDIDSIMITLGGGERMMNMKVIDKYCEKTGKDKSKLTQADKDIIIKNAKNSMKKSFDYRKVAEPKIKELKKKEESFIAELKKQGLLASSSNKKFFGIDKSSSNFDINTRLTKLYSLKNLVLNMVDKDKVAGIDDKKLVTIISQWIYWSEKKDRPGFYEYMRKSGYINDTLIAGGDFAWVLVETINYDGKESIDNTNKGEVFMESGKSLPGSYNYEWKYIGASDTYYDPDKLNGESCSIVCTFSAPPKVINAGEKVSLDMSLAFAARNLSYFTPNANAGADFDKWDVKLGFASGESVRFVNKEGKSSFTISAYKTIKVYSVSDTITATAPTGAEGKRIALRTSFFPGAKMGTCYIYEWKKTP